jgi:hypothetical protein
VRTQNSTDGWRASAWRWRAPSSFGAKREILIDMAQKWLGLAQEQEVPEPVKQQQQQVQPQGRYVA